jgi:hypothetical protein
MKKLRLDLDALEVDSFHTEPVYGEGTVHGEQIGITGWHSCGHPTCQTCLLSCGPVTHCGGVQTCGQQGTAMVSAGPVTHCGGVYTCGKYGEWREMLMPQSMASGIRAGESVLTWLASRPGL